MYPTAAVVLSTSKYQVSSGETFTAQVSGSGKNFVLTISASVIGVTVWHYSVSQTLSTAPKANSAEWIAEAPCSGSPCTIAPLANFGTVDFSGIGSTGRASAKGFTDTEITMATKNSATIKARPSSLSSGGTAFSVTWAHS
jgi:hypothetical protein